MRSEAKAEAAVDRSSVTTWSGRDGGPTAAPAILKQRFANNFLADVRIEHGPRDVFGPLFLQGDTMLRERGINLQFASVDELIKLNRANRDSWRPLLPIFDADLGGFTSANGFCLLARDASGTIIGAQGARLYDMTGSNFKAEAESLRLFYPDPSASRQEGEQLTVTSPSAETFDGPLIFSGAVWYHPTVRRQGLAFIMPRISKAISLTRWGADVTMTFMAEELVASGLAGRTGYANIEFEVDFVNTPVGTLRAALVWSNAAELTRSFGDLRTLADAKIDTVVNQRSA